MKSNLLLALLIKDGWRIVAQRGSHRKLNKQGHKPITFAFHKGVEVGPVMVAKIAKAAGLKLEE